MMNKLTSFFKKTETQPQDRYVYAVTTGTYAGELLVFVESTSNQYNFLSLPKMENREVPCDKFAFAYQNKIIEVVRKLPSNIYSICKQQYIKNKSSIKKDIKR